MKQAIQTYFRYFTIHFKSCMQYKISFLLTFLGQFLVCFSVFLGVYFMFLRFSAVKGFTYSDCLLCYAIILMGFSLAECFFRGFDLFQQIIANGEFDRILVRPRSLIFQQNRIYPVRTCPPGRHHACLCLNDLPDFLDALPGFCADFYVDRRYCCLF